LLQISHGQLTARKFDRYDINGYRFQTAKLEASRPLAATTNSGVVANAYSADGQLDDYYGILQDITKYKFGGHKTLRLLTFNCIWFDPQASTRVDEFGMVEVKHASRYKGNEYNNIMLAHQAHQVYYPSYPHQGLKTWWVVYKVNPDVHPYRYNNYNVSTDDTDDDDIVYQEVGDQADDSDDDNIVFEGAGLNELASLTLELLVEPDPLNSKRQKSMRLLGKQQRVEQLNARVIEEDSDADDF
jgi:hypothetical protein